MFVQRDDNKKIIGVFANRQDFTTEELPEDHEEILAFINPPKTWKENRTSTISAGGYGTINEQLEMMNEQGFDAWQKHCKEVKDRYPKE